MVRRQEGPKGGRGQPPRAGLEDEDWGQDHRCITDAIIVLTRGHPSPATTITGDTQWPRAVLSAKHVSSLQCSSDPTPSAVVPCAGSVRRSGRWDSSPGGPALQLLS